MKGTMFAPLAFATLLALGAAQADGTMSSGTSNSAMSNGTHTDAMSGGSHTNGMSGAMSGGMDKTKKHKKPHAGAMGSTATQSGNAMSGNAMGSTAGHGQ